MSIPYSVVLVAMVLAGCGELAQQETEAKDPPRRAERVGQALSEHELAPEPGTADHAAPPRSNVDVRAPAAQLRPRSRAKQHPATAAAEPRHTRGGGAAKDVTHIQDLDIPGGDAILPPGIVRHVMQSHFRTLVPCAVAEKRRSRSLAEVTIDFGIRGTGQVGLVAVNGMASGPLQACIKSQMRNLRFPAFDGQLTRARFSMTVQ